MAAIRARAPMWVVGPAVQHAARLTSRAAAVLAHTGFEGREARRTAVVLHGILGNKANLRSFSKNLVERNPSWRFVLLDHRGHGDSPSLEAPHNVQACAADCLRTLGALGVLDTLCLVIGHSFGGKVAAEASSQLLGSGSCSAQLHTWMLDTPPGRVLEDRGSSDGVLSVFAHVSDVQMPVRSKEALVDELHGRGLSLAIAKWMTTNLKRHQDGGYTWKFDVAVACQLLESYKRTDCFPAFARLPGGASVHVVMARRNPQWKPEVLGAMDASDASLRAGGGGRVQHHWVDSGHWVHIEAAAAVSELVQAHSLDIL